MQPLVVLGRTFYLLTTEWACTYIHTHTYTREHLYISIPWFKGHYREYILYHSTKKEFGNRFELYVNVNSPLEGAKRR